MNLPHPLTTELTLLAWSTVLLGVLVALQSALVLRERGIAFNAGPRDAPRPLGVLAGRAQRSLDNFKETYPAFVALALMLAITGRGGGLGEAGAWLWLLARIVYVPLYLFGVPWLRSLAWLAAAFGLILMLVRLL